MGRISVKLKVRPEKSWFQIFCVEVRKRENEAWNEPFIGKI